MDGYSPRPHVHSVCESFRRVGHTGLEWRRRVGLPVSNVTTDRRRGMCGDRQSVLSIGPPPQSWRNTLSCDSRLPEMHKETPVRNMKFPNVIPKCCCIVVWYRQDGFNINLYLQTFCATRGQSPCNNMSDSQICGTRKIQVWKLLRGHKTEPNSEDPTEWYVSVPVWFSGREVPHPGTQVAGRAASATARTPTSGQRVVGRAREAREVARHITVNDDVLPRPYVWRTGENVLNYLFCPAKQELSKPEMAWRNFKSLGRIT